MRRTLTRFNIRGGGGFVDRTITEALKDSYKAQAEANNHRIKESEETYEERVHKQPELADVYLSVNTSIGKEMILIKPTKGDPIGITSIWTHPSPLPTLTKVYDHTLAFLAEKFPETSVYRQSAENLTKARRAAVVSATTNEEVEAAVGSGLVEEIIIQAAEEFQLAELLAEEKPWEPLEETPVPGQWTAFAFDEAPAGPR